VENDDNGNNSNNYNNNSHNKNNQLLPLLLQLLVLLSTPTTTTTTTSTSASHVALIRHSGELSAAPTLPKNYLTYNHQCEPPTHNIFIIIYCTKSHVSPCFCSITCAFAMFVTCELCSTTCFCGSGMSDVCPVIEMACVIS
jgi:hypothetical protein